MNVQMLKESNRIIFESVAGSHLYNLNTEKSDIDIRGIYVNPPEEYLGLTEPSNQIGDEKHDTTYYSLKRFFELAMTANPNITELLWVPDSCVRIKTPIMQKLMDNRDLFISKKCYHTHIGYSHAQIEKCKGANKMVNHPEMFEKPLKENFCWVIPSSHINTSILFRTDKKTLPCRPIQLKDFNINLSEYHCAALEHVPHTYRLYFYGSDAKGIFRGDDMLVCEPIPIESEALRFWGLLIYNEHEYEKALQQHRKYNEWLANRNESRWVDQEKGKLNYDQKNVLHCMRLLMSGENILRNGCPLVRFEGEQRDYLMRIRAGEFQYEDLMKEIENRMGILKELYNTSTIPHSVDHNKIESLYKELTEDYEQK